MKQPGLPKEKEALELMKSEVEFEKSHYCMKNLVNLTNLNSAHSTLNISSSPSHSLW